MYHSKKVFAAVDSTAGIHQAISSHILPAGQRNGTIGGGEIFCLFLMGCSIFNKKNPFHT